MAEESAVLRDSCDLSCLAGAWLTGVLCCRSCAQKNIGAHERQRAYKGECGEPPAGILSASRLPGNLSVPSRNLYKGGVVKAGWGFQKVTELAVHVNKVVQWAIACSLCSLESICLYRPPLSNGAITWQKMMGQQKGWICATCDVGAWWFKVALAWWHVNSFCQRQIGDRMSESQSRLCSMVDRHMPHLPAAVLTQIQSQMQHCVSYAESATQPTF